MHPLVSGDYPKIMKTNAGSRIPTFTKMESDLVKGSFDFIGVNYYTAMLITHTDLTPEPRDYLADMATKWVCMSYKTNESLLITC